MAMRALILFAFCYLSWPAVSSHQDLAPSILLRGESKMALRSLRLRGGEGVVVPGIAWSQRADSLHFKVDMPPGVHTAEGLQVSDTHITWKENGVDLSVEFFAPVKANEVKIASDGGRQIKVNVPKLESAWWSKLTKGPKPNNVKVDWATWKDENEGMEKGGKDEDFNYDDAGKEDPAPWTGNDDKDDDIVGDGNAMGEDMKGAPGDDDGDAADGGPLAADVGDAAGDAAMPDA